MVKLGETKLGLGADVNQLYGVHAYSLLAYGTVETQLGLTV